jgi:hypothetical protein
MVFLHPIYAPAALGSNTSAMVASDLTDSRSWSAWKGSLIKWDRGIRGALGTTISIGACP